MSAISALSRGTPLRDETEMFSKVHLLGISASAVAAVVWSLICVAVDWKFVGFAGMLLGLLVGASAWGVVQFRGDAVTGLAASLITVVALCIGATIQRTAEIESAIKGVDTDESYIMSIAEDLLWQKASVPAEPTEIGAATATEFSTPGIGIESIPAEVRQAAETQWRQMSHDEKQKFREARSRWQTTSQGVELENMNASGGWLSFLSVVGIAASLSAAIVAWPAIMSRYFGWEVE